MRYRLPAGSVPPMTDVVGHLLAVGPTLSVRTKRGDVVAVAAADVVAIKALAAAPVRTGDIRNIEHAAALAWPGVEQRWLGGWLLRFGRGSTRRANSAVPLGVPTGVAAGVATGFAPGVPTGVAAGVPTGVAAGVPTGVAPGVPTGGDLSALIDWYAARGVAPLIAAPDRLFRVPPGVSTEAENLVMTADVTAIAPTAVASAAAAAAAVTIAAAAAAATAVTIAARPDDDWQSLYRRDVPVDVLTAVVGGEVAFATTAGAAVGRAAVTTAPDGTRWVGLSAVRVAETARRRGLAREICEALLAWGADRGATRTYVQVLADNTAATRLYESMGFSVHHRSRYVSAHSLRP